MIILGCDPGASGALSLVESTPGNRPDILLAWLPLKTGRPLRYDGARLAERVREIVAVAKPDAVYLEAALSLPRDDGARRRRALQYGQAVGEARAALGAVLGLPIVEVQSGLWMAALGFRWTRPRGLSDDAWSRERKRRIRDALRARVNAMDGSAWPPFATPLPVYAADSLGVAVYGAGDARLRGRLSV